MERNVRNGSELLINHTAKPRTRYCQSSRKFDPGRPWIMAQKLAATSRTGRDNQRKSFSLCLDHPRQPSGAIGASVFCFVP